MKLLQINTTINSGSTGRISEDIGRIFIEAGHESAIAFGRGDRPSASQKIKVGGSLSVYWNVLNTRLLDNHGFTSRSDTKKLIIEIIAFGPDIIGLHNLHGYYLHVGELFEFLKELDIPIVWTLHDCWSYTGHCAHYMRYNCGKWKTECYDCPATAAYPQSLFRDNSNSNFHNKRQAFTGHNNLTIVTPSTWLADEVRSSFLRNYPVEVIANGIDLSVFIPKPELKKEKIILGVASVWTDSKGLNDFVLLRKLLSADYKIVLVGLNKKQKENLPDGILGIERTESIEELADWYRKSIVFVNPTYVDNFPTTNLEALACGTPVITYNTGGSPEAIDALTGIVVTQGDIPGIKNAIDYVISKGNNHFQELCRNRAEQHFDKNERYLDYLKLYNALLETKLTH